MDKLNKSIECGQIFGSNKVIECRKVLKYGFKFFFFDFCNRLASLNIKLLTNYLFFSFPGTPSFPFVSFLFLVSFRL